jgi:hypothetical protein
MVLFPSSPQLKQNRLGLASETIYEYTASTSTKDGVRTLPISHLPLKVQFIATCFVNYRLQIVRSSVGYAARH